jgi:hypothetical protein
MAYGACYVLRKRMFGSDDVEMMPSRRMVSLLIIIISDEFNRDDSI